MPSDPPKTDSSPPAAAPRQATLWQVASAVGWSFFGIRKGNAMQRDAVTVKPLQVVVVGVVLAALIVGLLLLLVRIIISQA